MLVEVIGFWLAAVICYRDVRIESIPQEMKPSLSGGAGGLRVACVCVERT
jgi:hypothetical protein